jgi:hypothetical protein
LKHTIFVYAAVVSLVTCGFAEARVEAEYSGSPYSESDNSAWGAEGSDAPVALTEPTDAFNSAESAALQPAPVQQQPWQRVQVQPPAPVAVELPPQAARSERPVAPTSQLAYAPGENYSSQTELHTKAAKETSHSMRITPMVGSGDYLGQWSLPNKNNYSLGVAVELLNDSPLAIEIEGGYANHSLAYTSLAEPSMGFATARLMAHNFDVFTIGANAKVYIHRGTLRSYIGGGLAGVYYSRMQQRMPGDFVREFDAIVGSGQLLGGAEVALSKEAAVGIRGSWTVPLLNRPVTRDNGMNSAPGFEEAALINTSYYKIMGTVSVDL